MGMAIRMAREKATRRSPTNISGCGVAVCVGYQPGCRPKFNSALSLGVGMCAVSTVKWNK